MKFRNKKFSNIIRKGLALTLAVSMFGGLLPALPAKAASHSVDITEKIVKHYYNYTTAQNQWLSSDKYGKDKERIVALSGIVNYHHSSVQKIPKESVDNHQTDKVVWNPSQKQVDEGRDLYFLQWTNGTNFNFPGSYYEILCRIAYITTSGEIRYSKKVNVDDYPVSFQGLGNDQQWQRGIINQCYFAMPDDCAQIIGIFLGNQSGGGNNNNEWYMDNLYISRITSDKVSDISTPTDNGKGYKISGFKNGELVGYVSDFDIGKKYLNKLDVNQEWLYLLCTPEDDQQAPVGGSYYAQIVTSETKDLFGKGLKIKVSYTDINGISRDTGLINVDDAINNFYPKMDHIIDYDDQSYWIDEPLFKNYTLFNSVHGWIPVKIAASKDGDTYFTQSLIKGKLANDIAFEVQKIKNAPNRRDITNHLSSNAFHSYSWEDSNTTVTNYIASLFMGNHVTSEGMKNDILGEYTATDIPLNIPYAVKEITEIELSMNGNAGSANLQDVRIYMSSPESYTRTRMNGGISTERIFSDVNNARCLASVDQSKLINLNNDTIVTCSPEENENNSSYQFKLIYPNKNISLMAEDDNLGVQISIADLYDAGFDLFAARIQADFDKIPEMEDDYGDYDWGVILSPVDNMKEFQTLFMYAMIEEEYITKDSMLELYNILNNYYKESLTLHIEYFDDFGSLRKVEIPFITSYLMQLYSDNGGKLGTNADTHLTGIFQQGQDVALRVPLSQYSDISSIRLTFGESPKGVENVKNLKWYNDPSSFNNPELLGDEVVFGDTVLDNDKVVFDETYTWENWIKDWYSGRLFVDRLKPDVVKKKLWPNETFPGGIQISRDETFTIRSIRLYNNVTKEEFHTEYDPNKRVPTLSNSRTKSDYYYAAKDKNGVTISYNTKLNLSTSNGTLIKGSIDYNESDLKNTYLVEINGQSIYGTDQLLSGLVAKDLYVTLGYTTTGGEEKKISSTRLSSLSKDYNGKVSSNALGGYETAYELQTYYDITRGYICFTIDLEDVARFDYIHLSLPSGETRAFQANSITVYDLESLSQRYSEPRSYKVAPVFNRDFVGERVAFNNKPGALQPNKEGVTFYFTKVNADGTTEEPGSDNTYNDEYLTTPPTSMTYEETLKNLGLAISKYTYTVDVKVANVMDAGSSNYFYFQLVFENGTSGVVLANQQLAADSFRQGYTETFNIHTTQNYGNVTAVRVICDTSSSTSQAFDKLNIENITVTLPNKGSAKSWIVDKVGWIDINYQDEGIATTVSEDGTSGGFPNSQVVKEFARTRTASTARLLFSIATAAESSSYMSMPAPGTFEASLVYVDTAGYTQTYNFDLRAAVYNFNDNQNSSFIFRQNSSDHFTLSINDIASVKALNIYRSGGNLHWTIKDISISQFSDIGNVYRSTTGEFKRYIEDETFLTSSTNSNVMIEGAESATFTFADNSIVMDVTNTDPSGWTTTITRIPTTTQESFNVYLYAGSNANRTYTFNTANLPSIKGRMEYTLKEGGSTIGSTSFDFNQSSTINGTTVLKATGIKTTGMNQLKTLHLETSSAGNPIISGARVERIRGNTIVETLYFDYGNVSMNAGENYSAIAKKDTLSSETKQTLALQLTSGQQQLFTTSSDVAVAIHYTTESSAQDNSKAIYSSPYVFFTDVGITSVGNASILEIPFQVTGADQIVGISIVSTGPNIKFENAVIYNFVLNANGEIVIIDTCQIAESFSTSTVEKQLMEDTNSNVTPVTFTFTTSADGQFPGAGTSGRLPLFIHYKTIDGKDATLEFENFAALLPANTLPTAGSTVSFNVQLSNFSHLTDIVIGARDDDWHLNKVSAEVNKLNNALSTSYNVEAFVDQWITSKTSATAVFTGNDAQNSLNEIVSFSVTGKTSKSANVATATSGNVLTIKATPGEIVTFTPQVTATGNPANNVIWDTSNYASYMTDSGNVGLTFRVPDNSIGQVYSFTGYCSFDTQKSVTIAIQVVDNVPATPGGGTTGDGTTGGDTGTVEEAAVSPEIAIVNGNNRVPGPTLPLFTAEEGAEQTYTIFVNPTDTAKFGEWIFDYETNSDVYDVEFTPTQLTVDTTSGGNVTMLCKKDNDELFKVTFKVIVSDLEMNISGTGKGITLPTNSTLSASNNSCIVTIPYSDTAEDYSLSLSVPTNSAVKDYATAMFTANGSTLNFSNQKNGVSYESGTTIKTVYAQCAPINGTGYTLTVPIKIKVAD